MQLLKIIVINNNIHLSAYSQKTQNKASHYILKEEDFERNDSLQNLVREKANSRLAITLHCFRIIRSNK